MNFQQNFMNSLTGGLQFGQALKQQRDTTQINRLAGQAYSAEPEQRESLLAQMQQINPQMAAEQEKALGMTDERRQKGLINAARILVNTPEQFRAGQYARMVPGLSRYGLSSLPPEYNAETSGLIMETAQGLVRAADGAGSGGTLQSQKVGDDGFIYNTFRDGRMVNTGVRADRQMWFRDHPGMDPQLVGKDGSVQTVGMAQDGTAVAPAAAVQPQRADMEADIELANSMIAAGIPEAQVDAFLAQRGQRASAAAPVAPPAQAGYGTPAGGSLARPSQAQEAAATERAKLQAQLDFLPQQQAIETQGAIDRAVGIEQGKAGIEQASAAPGAISTMEQTITAIDELLNSPDLGSIVGFGSMNPLNRIPGTAARGLIARAEQISGQAFLAAFNQLKGGGAITEKEGQAATAAMARLDRSQSLTDYQTALRDLRAAIAPALERQRAALARGRQQGGSQPARAQPSAAPVQRARNPQTGQVVEFRNGQWVPVQ